MEWLITEFYFKQFKMNPVFMIKQFWILELIHNKKILDITTRIVIHSILHPENEHSQTNQSKNMLNIAACNGHILY